MSTARQYELMYIVSPEATDQELADLHGQVEGIVGRFEGKIDKTEAWGKRRLAYPIKRHREGHYVLDFLTGPGDMVKELDRRLKVIDQVVRHLIVRVDEDVRVAERRRAEREAWTAKRREARGLPPESAERRPEPEVENHNADDVEGE
jgi:small subunit ribosomal protein S6